MINDCKIYINVKKINNKILPIYKLKPSYRSITEIGHISSVDNIKK